MKIKLISFGTLFYIGLGFLVHMMAVGTTIAWSSAFSLFVIALWPFYLLYLVLWFVWWIAIIVVVCIAVYATVEYIKDRL